MKEATENVPVVFVVDDDASVRVGLDSLLRSVDLQVETFADAAEFLQRKPPDVLSCLVLDVRLPGLSGLDLQAVLAKLDIHIPIIFITGHGDIPMSVRAMRAGAVEFLTKPLREQELLNAVQIALERNHEWRAHDKVIHVVRTRYLSLTLREQEVMGFITAGLMNKQIAAEVGLSEATVKVHRGIAMRKMGARSLADLLRMAVVLGFEREAVAGP